VIHYSRSPVPFVSAPGLHIRGKSRQPNGKCVAGGARARLAQDPTFSVGFDGPLSQSTGRAGQAEAARDTCDRISHHAPASSSATRAGGPPMEQREAQRQAELEPSVPPKVRLVSLPLSCRAGWSKESVPWVRGAGFWGGERAWRRTLMRFRCAFFICSVIDWLLDVM
jgi:hypothetical protein